MRKAICKCGEEILDINLEPMFVSEVAYNTIGFLCNDCKEDYLINSERNIQYEKIEDLPNVEDDNSK